MIVGRANTVRPYEMFGRIRRGGLRPPVKCIVKGERYMKAPEGSTLGVQLALSEEWRNVL